MSEKKLRTFNQSSKRKNRKNHQREEKHHQKGGKNHQKEEKHHQKGGKNHKKEEKYHQNKEKNQRLVKVGEGSPVENVSNPQNGLMYVDAETGNTYLFAEALGWVDQSSWQPDVGEGPPIGEMAPEDPMTGDQYIDVIAGDFYFYSEGFGWVLGNGTEGPQGPPGKEEFDFTLVTTLGPTGPTLSGPLKITPGCKVQLWIDEKNGRLLGDVIPGGNPK